MYVSILAPKTRRVYRRQHVRIDEAAIIDYSCALWGNAAADAKLFALSSGSFRTRWNAIARAAGFDPVSIKHAVTPACLRGSGATALYRKTNDVRLVQWRGRWSRPQTLEAYIQEAAAAQSLLRVPEECRAKVLLLSEHLPSLLDHATSLLARESLKKQSDQPRASGGAPAHPALLPR